MSDMIPYFSSFKTILMQYHYFCRDIRELFSETVEMKIPCTATERRKIVLFAAHKLVLKYDGIKSEKNCNNDCNNNNDDDKDKDNNNNDDNSNDNNSNNDNSNDNSNIDNDVRRNLNIINQNNSNDNNINDNDNNVSNTTGILFNDEILDDISDSLIGYPSYSLFIESHKILKNVVKNMKFDKNNAINNNKSIKKSELNSRKKSKIHLDFPFLYGHENVKKSLTENLLWPNTLSQLYRTLSPHRTLQNVFLFL